MQSLVITLDGLGDRPAPQFGGRTALEAAHTPNLDAIADQGINGLFTSVGPGVAAGTPVGHALLFGYRYGELPGRAVFHAVARGIVPQPGDVVSLTRFASVARANGGGSLVQRMMTAPEEESTALAEAVRTFSHDGVEIELVYTGATEGLLFLRGGVSDAVTDCDPLGTDLPVIAAQPMDSAEDPEAAAKTAAAINAYLRWAHGVLREHPVNVHRAQRGEKPMNFLLPKWAGRRRPLPSFEERYGFKAVILTSEEILIGVARELGMDTWEEEDHDTERDLRARLAQAAAFLGSGYDFVHIHTKEPDATAHMADPEKKRDAIEALDRGMETLREGILQNEDVVTVVTADHCTPSVVSGSLVPGRFHDQHSGEPVPLAIAGRNALRDHVASFSERACARGGLGLVRGGDFMNILLSQTERTNVIGWRAAPGGGLYRPKRVTSFEF